MAFGEQDRFHSKVFERTQLVRHHVLQRIMLGRATRGLGIEVATRGLGIEVAPTKESISRDGRMGVSLQMPRTPAGTSWGAYYLGWFGADF